VAELIKQNRLNTGPSQAGWHRIESVLRCPRLYALTHIADAKPRVISGPLVRGSLVHEGLAYHYLRQKCVQQDDNENLWLDPLSSIQCKAEEQPEGERDVWMGEVKRIQKLVAAYITHWGNDSDWKVLDVERELKAKLLDPDTGEKHLYTQRADLIVEWENKVWIVDHKTTYAIIPKTMRRYTLSGQMLGYAAFGRALYKDKFGGVLLNMIRVPAKETDKNYDFKRVPVEPAPAAHKSFKTTILEGERRIKHYKERYAMPDDWPGVYSEQTCWTAYGPCPMQDICRWGF
tara:strand:- start:7842 stop:8708 length:867 start_codon:yes stop_codon:yes gene_type:complete